MTKDASNAPAETSSISYEFDVFLYKRSFGFLIVSSEENVDSQEYSTYRDVRRHAGNILKEHSKYTQVKVKKLLNWVYAGNGGRGEEDTKWFKVSGTGVTDWFGPGEDVDGFSSYRVRVYLSEREDDAAARKELKKWQEATDD